jgi:hypothetical protein
MLNCIPPPANAVICTTPVVAADEDELETDEVDDILEADDSLDELLIEVAELLLTEDKLLADDRLLREDALLGAELLLEDTGTTTPV